MAFNLYDEIKSLSDEVAKFDIEYTLQFLKLNGYRPKNTKEYVKGLNYRLRKKGLIFVIFHEQNRIEFVNNEFKVKPLILKIMTIDEYNEMEERIVTNDHMHT